MPGCGRTVGRPAAPHISGLEAPHIDKHSRVELLRRQYQTGFDQALGAGRVLVLVDVTMPAGGMLPQEAQGQTRRWPGPNLGARPQGNMVPSSNLTKVEVETWLVVNGDLTPSQSLKDKLDLPPSGLVPLAAP